MTWKPTIRKTVIDAAVASRMGYSIGIVHQHYKNLHSKKEAVEFWGIAPAEAGLIQFPKAAG